MITFNSYYVKIIYMKFIFSLFCIIDLKKKMMKKLKDDEEIYTAAEAAAARRAVDILLVPVE